MPLLGAADPSQLIWRLLYQPPHPPPPHPPTHPPTRPPAWQAWSYPGGMTPEKKAERGRALAVWIRETILQLGPTFIKLGAR